jgi:hypothetical protein
MQPISKPSLLSCESESEFASLRAEIEDEIKPKGIIERIFVDDLTVITWEIFRLRRIITGIIRNTFPAALQSLHKQLSFEPYYLQNLEVEEEAAKAATAYFHDPKAKKNFMEMLCQVGLDEGAIEAEAFRLAGADLERFDKMLSARERRRYKALRFIARYRQSLAIQIRQVTDRIIAKADMPRLQPSTSLDHGE